MVHQSDNESSSTKFPKPMTREEMSRARVPLAYRDSCASLLVPLNECRFREYYLPWKCQNERHAYEKCEYLDFKHRVRKMNNLRAKAASQQASEN